MSSKEETNRTKSRATIDVDMSERAINARREEVGALYKLGISLMQAGQDAGLVRPRRTKP
jgi:hypothetical protein